MCGVLYSVTGHKVLDNITERDVRPSGEAYEAKQENERVFQ